MSEHQAQLVEAAGAGTPWHRLYRAGGLAAFVFVALVLVPVLLLFAAPMPPTDGAGVLAYIAEHRWVYLAELICFVGLSVPALIAFVALAVAVRAADRGMALLGGLLGVASETIALALGSSPQSLHGGLVVLSDAYQQTGDAGRHAALVAASEALIAATNAVSWAGILTAAAILVLSLLMRRAGFGAGIAVLGILTGILGIASEAFRPMIGPAYFAYGLLLPLWFGLLGWRLLRRSGTPLAAAQAE